MIKYICAIFILVSINSYALPEPKDKSVYDTFIRAAKKVVLNDEYMTIKNNKKSLLMGDSFFPALSPESIYGDYKKNEIVANRKYKNKSIRIKGVAESISEDFTGKGVIKTTSPDIFVGSAILNVDKNDEYILSLSSGSDIDMICKGGSFVMGSPVLNDCISTKSYMLNMLESKTAIKEIDDIVDGVGYLVYFAYSDVISKNCRSEPACESFISTALSNGFSEKTLGITEDDHKKRMLKLMAFVQENKKELGNRYPFLGNLNK